MAKAYSKQVADELLRLGWTLRTEFRGEGDHEPYEYLFEWLKDDEPVYVAWNKFGDGHSTG